MTPSRTTVPVVSGLVRQSSVLLLGSGAAAGLGAVYLFLAGRMLGPATFGMLSALMSLAGFSAIFVGPVESAITRVAAELAATTQRGTLRHLLDEQLVRFACGTALVGGVAAVALPWVFSGRVGWLESGLLLAYVLAVVLISVPRGILRGQHRFDAYFGTQLSENVARLGIGVPLMFVVGGTASALAGYCGGALLALLVAVVLLRDLPQDAKTRHPHDVLDVARPLFIAYVYSQLIMNLDMLAAERFLAPTEAGGYGAAVSITRLLALAATPVNQVLLSHVASRQASGQPVWGFAMRFILAVAGASLASCAVPLFYAPTMLALIFGPAFQVGSSALILLWVKSAVMIAEGLLISALFAARRARGIAWLLVPGAAVPALLAAWHATPSQVAAGGLFGAALGLGPLAWMVLRAMGDARVDPSAPSP